MIKFFMGKCIQHQGTHKAKSQPEHIFLTNIKGYEVRPEQLDFFFGILSKHINNWDYCPESASKEWREIQFLRTVFLFFKKYISRK